MKVDPPPATSMETNHKMATVLSTCDPTTSTINDSSIKMMIRKTLLTMMILRIKIIKLHLQILNFKSKIPHNLLTKDKNQKTSKKKLTPWLTTTKRKISS